ncbi:UNKNOWN [Stylonychia lemnae]|uniref:Uncharacterized protein n=1 Tax=Stylonychia lemnae TaxID=5949 RepID=A0A078BBQ2_STYLE|nr:UNKNOWN [Stylonychia lemnae]|eukprot:CDW91008.1 UNKNOWN [Stylonychia lemnae]
MLMEYFSEEELQEMFEDVRFFFPDDEVYDKIEIFRVLDIFNGDHRNIKKSYKIYKLKQKLSFKFQQIANNKDLSSLNQQSILTNNKQGLQSIEMNKSELVDFRIMENMDSQRNQREPQLKISLIDLDREVGLEEDEHCSNLDTNRHIEKQQVHFNRESTNRGRYPGHVGDDLLTNEEDEDQSALKRMRKLTIDEYKQFQQYRERVDTRLQSQRESSQIHPSIVNIITNDNSFANKNNKMRNQLNSIEQQFRKQNSLTEVSARHSQDQQNISKAKKDDLQNIYEKQIRYQMKLKQVELNKIRNVYQQVAQNYVSNAHIKQKQQSLAMQRLSEAENNSKIVAKYLPEVQRNMQEQNHKILKDKRLQLELHSYNFIDYQEANNHQKGIFSYRSSREQSSSHSTKNIQLQPDYSHRLEKYAKIANRMNNPKCQKEQKL